MGHQSKTESIVNREESARRSRPTQLLCAVATGLFLFVGSGHAQSQACPSQTSPCLFVSVSPNGTQQVEKWQDNGGKVLDSAFLKNYPNGGGGGGEGVACLSGNMNVMYTANNLDVINTFDLTSGSYKPNNLSLGVGTHIGALSINRAGTVLYAGQYHPAPGNIWSLTPLTSSPWVATLNSVSPPTGTSHDVALGNGSPLLDGNVFGTYTSASNTGVNEYDATLNPNPILGLPKQFLSGNNCYTFSGVSGTRCTYNLAGMTFDSEGNLWVVSDESQFNGVFEFDSNGNPLNFTPDPQVKGQDPFPIGITIAPANDPSYPNNIVLANYNVGTISRIDPTTCTGPPKNKLPGTCTLVTFFSTINPNPNSPWCK